MNVEYLSDHVGDLIREARHKLRLLKDEQAYWESEIRQAEYDLTEARRRWPFLRRLLNLPVSGEPKLQNLIVESERAVRSIVGGISEVEREIVVLEGGAEGEKRFEDELKWLSDDWTMFRGYSNQRGELDAVLVGPDGIWTVEVKNWRARLRIDGDRCERRDAFSGARGAAPTGRGGLRVGRSETSPSRSRPVFAALVTALRFAPDVARIQQLIRDDHRYWERRFQVKRA